MGKKDSTRRQFLKGTAATVLGGSLAGCGSDNEPDAEPTESPTPTPTESPTTVPTESPAPTPTATPTETPTPTESPTPEKPEPGIAPEIRFEDPEGLTRQLGEEEIKNGELEDNQTIHTIQLDQESRKSKYKDDAINTIGEDAMEDLNTQMEEWDEEYDFEDMESYIIATPSAMKESGLERSNFESEEWVRLIMACTRNTISDLHGDDLDETRVGFIPFVDTETTQERETEYLTGGEIIDTEDDYHKLKWADAYDPSSVRKAPGEVGFLDGEGDLRYAAPEIDLMIDQIEGGVTSTLTVDASDVQGMLRDLAIGFTNWNQVHDLLGFEGRDEVEFGGQGDGWETDTPSKTSTLTPGQDQLPTVQMAVHVPYARDSKNARLESDNTKMDHLVDISDALTDRVLNGDNEETYGILLGGYIEDPYPAEVGYEDRELFNAVYDFQADRNKRLPEIIRDYRQNGIEAII